MSNCGSSIYNPDKSNREVINCEITLSEKAISILQGLMDGVDMWLYIMVKGGGCSGYIYELDLLEDEPLPTYQIISHEGVKLAVNKLDSSLLNGMLIDYEDKLMGGGFKMINPNATKTCGCGLSFK
tara:strand:- start:738 stop:1115 length:378 start_codon:yes stop_codon:yes gene_type:complete